MRRAKLAEACFLTSTGIDPYAINPRAAIIFTLFLLIPLTGCTEERPFMTTMVAQIFPTPTITRTLLPPSGYTLTPTHTHTPTPTDTPIPTNTPTDTPEPTETATPRPVPTPVPIIAPQPETNSLLSVPSVPLNTNTEQNRQQNAPILPPGTPPPTGVNNVFVPNPRPFNTAAPDLLSNAETAPYQSGTASVYADFFQGMTTSTGEPFDHNAWTAAHERLALGTVVRVTNLRDGRWVTVRINDRIPVGQPHIIDMTKAAAGALGNTNGIIPVRIDIVSWP